jgi:hypothetical protein
VLLCQWNEKAPRQEGRRSASTSQWQSASDEDWALALAREAVIRPLTDQPEVTDGLVVTASAELGISRIMIYRLVVSSTGCIMP